MFPMELHLGKMTNKELAEWFGLKPSSMTRLKKQKLEELKNYAIFEEVYGGVEITAIIKDTYNKKDNQIRQIYQQGFEEVRQPIDTVSNINNQIFEKYSEQLPTLKSPQSGYHYAIEVRNQNYGIPFQEMGNLGYCYYLWCKIEILEDGKFRYVEFSEEENQIKKELLKLHFKADEEKDILITQMEEAGEISEAQAWRITKAYRNLTAEGYRGFIQALEKAIGAKVAKATKFEPALFFDEKDKPAAIAGSVQH